MLRTLLSGALGILTTWLVLGTLLTGVGLGVRRLLGSSRLTGLQLIKSFWLGFGLTILFLQLWHFALAISTAAIIAIVLAGLAGLWFDRAELRAWLSLQASWKTAPRILLLAGVGLWAANWAMAPCTWWDSANYHLQVVRWNETYPVVPGLGNLFGNYAFNNSGLLFAAMLDVGPWSGREFHITNQLMFFVLLMQIVLHGFRLIERNPQERALSVFNLALLSPALWLVTSSYSGCLATDPQVTVVLFVGASILFGILLRAAPSAAEEAFDFVTCTTLLAVAVCLKLSSVAFSATAWLLVASVWLLRREYPRRLIFRTLVLAAAISAVLLTSWLGRGVMLSGYPAYPSAALSFPVEWRVPVEQAKAEAAYILHHHRTFQIRSEHSVAIGNTDWLLPWLLGIFREHWARVSILIPTILALLAWFIRLGFVGKTRDRPATQSWLLLGPILAAGVLWFTAAPGPRFGLFVFWLLFAWSAGHVFQVCSNVKASGSRLIGVLLVASLPLTMVPLFAMNMRRGGSFLTGVKYTVMFGPSDAWFQPLPKPKLHDYTTKFGVIVHMPDDEWCWFAELPCSPHPTAFLTRRSSNLRHGFRNQGPWEPVGWPHHGWEFLELWRRQQASN